MSHLKFINKYCACWKHNLQSLSPIFIITDKHETNWHRCCSHDGWSLTGVMSQHVTVLGCTAPLRMPSSTVHLYCQIYNYSGCSK